MSAGRTRRLKLVVFTDRPEQAVALLRDGLGLTPVTLPRDARRPGVTSFLVNGTQFDVVHVARPQGAVMLELAVDDLDATCTAVELATGVVPLGPIGLPWGGRSCGLDVPGGPALRIVEAGEGVRPPLPAAARAPARAELAVVACMDTRPDPLDALGVGRGEAHVITTPGGIVTEAVIDDLLLARRSLGISRVAVVQHRPCAFMDEDSCDDFRREPAMSRLRHSLDRLVQPPLAMPAGRVEGCLVWDDETVIRVGPVAVADPRDR